MPASVLKSLSSTTPPPAAAIRSSRKVQYFVRCCYANPPATRDEAIAQAKTCLAAALRKPLDNPVRRARKPKQPRYRVEIPVADDSPDSIIRLSSDVFTDLNPSRKLPAAAAALLLWPSVELSKVSAASFPSSAPVKSSALVSVAPAELDGCSFAAFVAPEKSQLGIAKEIADEISPKPAVLFNPTWQFEEEDELAAVERSFLRSFEVVYSFAGLEVKGMLRRRRGAVMRRVEDGEFGGVEGWAVMVEDGDKEGKMKVVSRFKRRPAMSEVESVLYNFVAANSPLAKSVKFIGEMAAKMAGKKRP